VKPARSAAAAVFSSLLFMLLLLDFAVGG